MLIIAGMAAVTLTGCQQQDEVTETPATEPSYVLADLALSLPPSPAGTRLDPGVTSGVDDSGFRGISELSIIPFTKRGKITKSDQPSIIEISNPISDYTQIDESNNNELYRYYGKVFLNHGVASFLTYGQGTKTGKPIEAKDVDNKVFYGSLISKVAGVEMTYIPDRLSVTAGDLSFELETIYNDRDEEENLIIPAEAQAIADYLTYIANTKVTVNVNETETEYKWSSKQINETLMGLYSSFISFQGSGKYGVIAGSAANVKAYVNELYQKLQNLINTDQNFGEGSTSLTIAEAIQSRIVGTGFISDYSGFNLNVNSDNKVTSLGSDTYDKYPSSRHLPDGAAVLQWGKITDTTYGFIPQIQTTNTANVSSMNRYTYPAELYYYGNSLIKTSNDEVPVSKYSGTSEMSITTWKDVVDKLYTSGSVVSSNTKAVAIVDPMQYAIARLQGTVLATSSSLNDAEDTPVSLTNNSFPITGLIVSGQYPVNFDFTPKLDGASEDNEHFVYDSYLGSNPLYLTASQTSPFYTLVMQTHDLEDVTVILELVNNSGTDFKGENGIVYSGTKFYLAGKVELSNGDATAVVESERDDVKSRVFTQDHTTVISMKVSSLAKAYNVMPNIQSGRLEVGVEINLQWEQATPKTIVFEE